MSNNKPSEPTKADLTFAAWSTRYLTPDSFVCTLTLQGESGKDMITRGEAAIDYLTSLGFIPYYDEESTSPASSVNGATNGHDPGWCPVHQVGMNRREKDGQVWYSHKAGDAWCRGK